MQQRSKWEDWLEEKVESPYGDVPRRIIMHRFVTHGLLPFLHGNGYRIGCSIPEFQSRLATGLWKNEDVSHLASDWSTIPVNNLDYLDEDLHHYHFTLDRDIWDAFWSNWMSWEDISESAWRGWDRRADIEAWVWSQIDLETSPQTKRLDEQLGINDMSSEEGDRRHRRNEDTYYRDAAESGEWGGYRKPKATGTT